MAYPFRSVHLLGSVSSHSLVLAHFQAKRAALPDNKKSYLQPHLPEPHYERHKCNGCGFETGIDKVTPPESSWGAINDGGGSDLMTS
jgi:hypothetical protein